MSLRVEKDLRMDHIVGKRPPQVTRRQIVKILFMNQYAGCRVVDIQKILQVVEPVCVADFLHRTVPKGNTVSCRHLEHQFRFKCTFDMYMQLCLGN